MVRIKRTYVQKIGPRKQRKRRRHAQIGSGYVDLDKLMRGLNLAKRGANTQFGKTVIDDAVSLLLKAYKSIKKRLFGCKKKKTVQSMSYYPIYVAASPTGERYN